MPTNTTNIDREFDWDDTIENDGEEFNLLPEGDYDFEVTALERSRYAGGAKLPPCNEAKLTIRITADDGSATTVFESLKLHSKMEWKLCEFFVSIGQRKKGEPLKMNWAKVVGSRGRCRLEVNSYTTRDGEEKQNNRVKKFFEPESVAEQAERTFGAKFTPGSF